MGAATVPLAIAATGYQIYSGEQARRSQQKALDNMSKPPAPIPTPTPADPNPEGTQADRVKKLQALKYGFASTMSADKNASSAPLFTPTATGKTKLGQ